MSFRGYELPRVLTRQTAARLGITESRIRTELRHGNWQRLARGLVLCRPDPPRRADWAAVGIALAGPSSALSGWGAVRIHGLGSPHPPDDVARVLSRHSSNRVIGQVRIRETHRPYRSTLTSALAEPYSLTPVVHPARAVTEWEDVPRQGSRFLRVALADVADGARSVAEAACAEQLRQPGIPPFDLNAAVRDDFAELVTDLYWQALRAALEVDSREYHFSEEQWKATMNRHNRLSALGISVVHYPPSTVIGRDRGWVDEVRAWLRRRAQKLGLDPP